MIKLDFYCITLNIIRSNLTLLNREMHVKSAVGIGVGEPAWRKGCGITYLSSPVVDEERTGPASINAIGVSVLNSFSAGREGRTLSKHFLQLSSEGLFSEIWLGKK